MKKTEWESHKRHLKNTLKISLLMPTYIIIWAICIVAALALENGSSLKASGWKCVGKAGGKRWTGVRRPEVDLYPAQMKLRFEIGEELESEG